MGLLEDRQADKRWLEDRIDEYNRIDTAYEALKTQKDRYEQDVRSARKNVFKDGWFKGSYDWKGSNYGSFETFGSEDVKNEVETYYRNGSNGLDDVLDELNNAKYEIKNRIRRRFGFISPFHEMLSWLAREIGNLMN